MKYAITNMTFLNGHEDMAPVEGKAIIVENGKIKDIIGETAIPSDCEKVDLGGKVLLPGLINLHVHLPSSGKPSKKKVNYEKVAKLLKLAVARFVVRKICESNAQSALLSGTTTIRAVGGVLDFDTKIRDKINSGKMTGPRILAANTAISVKGGHMTGSVAKAVYSAKEAAEMVDELSKQNPDLIKLMITGGVLDAEKPGEPGILKMPEEYVKAATEKAHSLGYKVAAHVEGPEGMTVALKNGVDTLEHGGKVSEEIIELFKEKNAVLVATLSPTLPFAVMDPSVSGLGETDIINGKALFGYMKDCTVKCLENGVTVGLGTDAGCPFTTHYDMWREVYYFTKFCNVTPTFALHTATEVNARILGLENETGTVDIGKSADFMVVEKNPLDDLTSLQHPTDVFIKGKHISSPEPKRIKIADTELDALKI